MALHCGLSTHSSLWPAHWEERALLMEEVGSTLAVCSPFLSLHAGSQQAPHIHSFQPPVACFGGSAVGRLFLDLSSK